MTPKKLCSRQRMSISDVDYNAWGERESIIEFSQISRSCLFTVYVFKHRYDFASESFPFFGYNPAFLHTIRDQGDMLEDRIHPDDRTQLTGLQVEHGLFIYSLPAEERNNYRQVFQYRLPNAQGQYMNVVGRQQVLKKDKTGKAWIIMGIMDTSPDQSPDGRVKRTIVNYKTEEYFHLYIFL